MKNKKGFTITEILVVIAVIGLILAIAIPSIVGIRKKSNERLLESKKDIILVAAELYAKDKGWTKDTEMYVYQLVDEGYITPDIKNGSDNCSGENTLNGCVSDPTNPSGNLNNERIVVKINEDNHIAIWDGTVGTTTDEDLIDEVMDRLGCTEDTVRDGECFYCVRPDTSKGETTDNMCTTDPDNYLYYSGIMWRVMGIYEIDGKLVAKMITEDTIIWND